MFDKDGSGYIGADELKEVLMFNEDIDQNFVNKMINEVDINKDGKISFEEFTAMMRT